MRRLLTYEDLNSHKFDRPQFIVRQIGRINLQGIHHFRWRVKRGGEVKLYSSIFYFARFSLYSGDIAKILFDNQDK